MKRYQIHFRYSTNGGKSYTGRTVSVSAESDSSAIQQVKSMFSDIKDIRIMRVN